MSASPGQLSTRLREQLAAAGLSKFTIEERSYPDEIILVVRVESAALEAANQAASKFDREMLGRGEKGFVVVRPLSPTVELARSGQRNLSDSRASVLVNLLNARARTSEVQPSLSYIPDAARNITAVVSPRHQLIFGRRGAGKTALLVEAKRLVEKSGDVAVWVNLQTFRHSAGPETVASLADRLLELIQVKSLSHDGSRLAADAAAIRQDISAMLTATTLAYRDVAKLLPPLQKLLRRFLDSYACAAYIFIDDLHYLARTEQPQILDMIHAIVRDCNAWLKIAGIRHLSRWFQAHPPLGLQTGHDVHHIDLDLTLENPSRAKQFLEAVLGAYAKHVGFSSVGTIFPPAAVDRLVLASGAVPRDFLVLAAASIGQAQRRERPRQVGVQDVNRAAGDAAKVKIAELEDDAMAIEGAAGAILAGLQVVRQFCVEERRFTFFRVDYRDKELRSSEYGVLQELMDLRLLHLVDPSVSDEHEAGRRSEVYMLDLSQFSGQRFKKGLRVLDFEQGHIALKETGKDAPPRLGATPRKRLGILRRGPLLELQKLHSPRQLPLSEPLD